MKLPGPRSFRRLGECLALLIALLLAPALLAAQQPPAPVGPGLTLQDAVVLARRNNPGFLSERNNQEVARWDVRAAYGSLLPSADAYTGFGYIAAGERRSGSVEFGEQPAYYSSDLGVGLSYELSRAKLLQPSLAKAQARATDERIESAAARLEADVKQQYLNVLEAQEQVAQATREVARVGEQLRLAQAKLEVGTGTQLDVRRAEVQQGQAEVRLLQAENAVVTQRLLLEQQIGTPLPPETRLASDFQLFEPELDPEALIAAALGRNDALQAARAAEDAASTGIRVARSAYLPSLRMSAGLRGSVFQAGDIDPLFNQSLGGLDRQFAGCQQQNRVNDLIGDPAQDCSLFDPNNPAIRDALRNRIADQNSGFPFGYVRQPFNASLSVSIPIYTGLTRQLQVEQARASAEDARLQVRAEELRLRSDITVAVQNLRTAYREALLQRRVSENAAEELRLARERFRFGAASSVEVTDAQTNLGQAEQAEINAVYNFHKILAALEVLTGQPLR